MAVPSALEFTKLTNAIGAAVIGVDLKRFGDDTLERIHQAFLDHCVLVFPNQFLQPEEHVAFARRFGEVMAYEGYQPFEGLPPGMFKFSNDGKGKVITENWHFDGTYYPAPPAAGILAPQRLPALGGDTMWANQYVAYERLSDGMKQLLAGLRCRCESHRVTRKYALGQLMAATQPAVRRHPETGRLSLNLGNPDTCVSFVGMTEAESAPLIRYLYSNACQPDAVYRHKWQLGDVLMWDNRCTMHYAIHDYGDEPREMYRMTLKGEPAKGPCDA
jgi:taurine dioxygenase